MEGGRRLNYADHMNSFDVLGFVEELNCYTEEDRRVKYADMFSTFQNIWWSSSKGSKEAHLF